MAAQLQIHVVANQTIRHLYRRQLVESLLIRPLAEVPMARQLVEVLLIRLLVEVPMAHKLVEALAIRALVEVPTIQQLVEPLTTLQQEVTQTILHLQVKIQPALAMTYKLRSLS